MRENLLHTPDGVRDIYGDECAQKHILEKRMHEVLHSYGYRDIETPTFEYFDVFGEKVGTTPSRELYKFFDREGATLVLRPDFTPSIARAASKYFMEEKHPIRLCYLGNTFTNYSNYRGHMKESTQMGAELISDPGPEADAEVIAMCIEMLLAAGLQDFQVSVGQVMFFESLVEQAGLEEDDEDTLRELIRNKNSVGVEKFLSGREIDPQLSRLLVRIPSMFGGEEILDLAEEMTGCEEAKAALERLRDVLQLLRTYGLERYISFDLGMMSGHQYYTGVIFRAYTYGTGEAIVKGGRYDTLLKNFGKDAPSIGFVVVINQLLNAMHRQNISIESKEKRVLILYDLSSEKDAVRKAQELRTGGTVTVLRLVKAGENIPPDSEMGESREGGERGEFTEILHMEGRS